MAARARKVDAFGRSSRRLARHLAEQGVRLADPGVTPKFVLQHNANYHRIWTSWQELLDRDRVLDELWRWQARSWEEFCTLAVVVALAGSLGKSVERKFDIRSASRDWLYNNSSIISHRKALSCRDFISVALPVPSRLITNWLRNAKT
jgi:hypothetical protein